ncbi:MAG TPA: ABC transporter permease [Flavisolibacter sp.]|nr:ABC transporter permease [Flavisolibacter sp.]
MNKLLKTEWLKIRKYRAFWWMGGLVLLSYPGINYIFYQIYKEFLGKEGDAQNQMMRMLLGNPFTFPEVWHTVAFASSLFLFIPSIVVIMFITNEYTYKTHRQNIIDGWSRGQFMMAKLVDVFLISLIITLLYICVALVIGYLNISEAGSAGMWSESKYIGLFFLQTFSQLSVAFLIAFLARKAFVALGIFIFYFIILEPVLVGVGRRFANDAGRFLPLEISDRMIPLMAFIDRDPVHYRTAVDNIPTQVALTVVLTGLTWALCFWLNKKRDL